MLLAKFLRDTSNFTSSGLTTFTTSSCPNPWTCCRIGQRCITLLSIILGTRRSRYTFSSDKSGPEYNQKSYSVYCRRSAQKLNIWGVYMHVRTSVCLMMSLLIGDLNILSVIVHGSWRQDADIRRKIRFSCCESVNRTRVINE